MNNYGEQASPDPGRVAYLVNGFLQDSLTEGERDELDEWIEAAPENMKLFEELTDEENLQGDQTWFQKQEAAQKRKRTRYHGIQRSIKQGVPSLVWYLTAAACVIGLLIGIYWLTKSAPVPAPPLMAKQENDLIDRTNKGLLILSNGQQIPFDSAGTIRHQDFTIENGNIVYTQKASDDTGHNTVVVPAGSQLKINLSDGSGMWLNAGTTMRYPVAFGSGDRTVELTGESYFEVTHNPAKPFKVISNGQTVMVLGTGFNINAYRDEKPKTTLVHGSVKISTPTFSKTLKPGEQSEVFGNEINIKTVDVNAATAWKEGLFVFKDETMGNIGKQIMRWYGVEVDYKKDIPYHFNATIDRKQPLEHLLPLLEATHNVHFKLENNRLTINP